MMIEAGTRLVASERCAYLLGEPWIGPWRRGRKVFWNYRHADRSLFEAAEAEWLDVLVRGPAPSLASLEIELGLLGQAPFPDPIDAFDSAGGAWLVVADLHASPVEENSEAWVIEARALDDLLSARGLTAGRLGPTDFAADAAGRLVFLRSDRVVPARSSGARP